MTMHSIKGLSIAEILIAMLLGLVLMAGGLKIFDAGRSAFRIQTGLAEVQDNARFAMAFLSRELRSAGYLGCTNVTRITVGNLIQDGSGDPTQNNPAYDFNSETTLRGDNNITTTSDILDFNYTSYAVKSSDTFVIRRGIADELSILASDMALHTDPIVLENIPSQWQEDFDDDALYLIITNCNSADIFKATNLDVASKTIEHEQNVNYNTNANFSYIYEAGSMVMPFDAKYYFIGTDSNNKNEPSLYEDGAIESGTPSKVWVSGIEHMQLSYLEEGGFQYVSADAITNWADIISIRVNLLVKSTQRVFMPAEAETLGLNDKTYELADKNLGPFQDGRLRRIYSFTVSLRNPL